MLVVYAWNICLIIHLYIERYLKLRLPIDEQQILYTHESVRYATNLSSDIHLDCYRTLYVVVSAPALEIRWKEFYKLQWIWKAFENASNKQKWSTTRIFHCQIVRKKTCSNALNTNFLNIFLYFLNTILTTK